MKNVEKWEQSKWICVLEEGNKRLVCTEDGKELGYSSWLVAQLVADAYSKYIPEFANGKLLDIGCGKFPLYGLYKDYVDECVGVDWENTLHKNENVDYFLDITKPLPFDSNSFETILCSDVLEHVYNPINVLDEMVRVLKSGGVMLINTPFQYWMHEAPYDYYRYTKFFFERYAKENDSLECIKVEKIGTGLDVVADIIGKIIGNKKKAMNIQKWFYKKGLTSKGIFSAKRSSNMALDFLAVYRKN